MTAQNNGKISLVEFLGSIKFSRPGKESANDYQACTTPFAEFQQRARTRRQYSSEDAILIRSAN